MGNSGPNYRGPLGQTSRQRILYVCPSGVEVSVEVFTQINAATDPELAAKLLAETGPLTIEDPTTKTRHPLHVRRLFHDPNRELFVLVLTDAHRHRELAARAELYDMLAATPEATVPDYVRGFDVAYSGGDIRVLGAVRNDGAGLEHSQSELAEAQAALKVRETQLSAREREFGNLEAELRRRQGELARRTADLSRERAEVARARTATDKDVLAAVALGEMGEIDVPSNSDEKPSETQKGMPHAVVPPRPASANLVSRPNGSSPADAATSPFDRIEFEDSAEIQLESLDAEEVGAGEVVVADQLVSEQGGHGGGDATAVGGVADVAIEKWISSREPSMATLDDAGCARFAISLPERSLEGMLSKELKVMIQLHSMSTFPLLTLSVGTADGFSKGRPAPATFHFNASAEADRAVIEALAVDFTFQIDLFDTEYLPVRRRTITAGLAPNARYVLDAADEALAKVKKRTEPSYTRALLAYDSPSYDRFGRLHPERKEFREDVLTLLGEPAKVRWALHVCRRFSTPEGESYLFLTRGYSIRLWKMRRRDVLARAAKLGLWMGSTLAGIAISEGIAGSRKELVETMARHFVGGVSAGNRIGLDEDAVRDNWTALIDELRAQGIDPSAFINPRSDAISSGLQDVASGTIGSVTALSIEVEGKIGPPSVGGGSLTGKSSDELVALLGDRDRRYEAALELCRSGPPSIARPLFSALRRMTRAEAGHVFGGVVALGEVATPHLIETLGSRKGFLRQGAALALAALGADDGLEPVCELLVSEPTDIWKEVARALGEYGPRAVMQLCAQLRGGSEVAHERIAWALAHVASRGDRIAIDTVAAGRDSLAAGVARHALELAELARSDNRSIWNPRTGREHTVKRAFSKRVFEAMPKKPRGTSEISVPLTGVNEVEDEVEQLDESDLLP